MEPPNTLLIISGILSCIAALLHVAVIIGGADWYRFFGAGKKLAEMAERGSWIPTVITLCITTILMIWALYAFSGAGILPRPPFLKTALVTISTIYLLRGLEPVYLFLVQPKLIDAFMVWSSLICLGYGILYALGTHQMWIKMGSS